MTPSKTLLAFAVCVALSAVGPALAEPTSQFGNTLVITDAKGGVTKVMMSADHTYTVVRPDGQARAGTWEMKDGNVCLSAPGDETFCTPDDTVHKVGDSWTQPGEGGATVKVQLVAGQ